MIIRGDLLQCDLCGSLVLPTGECVNGCPPKAGDVYCEECGMPLTVDKERASFRHALKLLRAATRWLEPGTCKIEIDEFLAAHRIDD